MDATAGVLALGRLEGDPRPAIASFFDSSSRRPYNVEPSHVAARLSPTREPPALNDRVSYWDVLRGNANFRKLWLAQLTSNAGDWFNDVPMFAWAGRSFAMGQSPHGVRSCATDVLEATSATGGGVAEAIDRWLGSGDRGPRAETS